MTDGNGGFKLIKSARLIDGKGGPALERGAILIEGDVIKAVGTEEAVVPPEGARVEEFNYEDKTVLPGLIDCHVHLVGIGDGRPGDELTLLPDEVLTLQAARNARAHLYSGVTTVRDCGAKNQTTFMLRKAMEMGITPGSRLVLTGRPLAIIGGHLSYFGIQATGPDECRAAVRQLVKEGADCVKITATGGSTRTSFSQYPSFNVDELKAICDEIHKFGKHAVAHCHNSQAMLNCLDAGIDTIVHGRHAEPDGSKVYREDVTERLVKQGVFINSNMHGARIRIRRLEAKRDGRGADTGRAGAAGLGPARPRVHAGELRPHALRRSAYGRRVRLGVGVAHHGQLLRRGRGPGRCRDDAHGGDRLWHQRLGPLSLGRRQGRHPGRGQTGRRAGRRRRPVAEHHGPQGRR